MTVDTGTRCVKCKGYGPTNDDGLCIACHEPPPYPCIECDKPITSGRLCSKCFVKVKL